MTKFIFRKPEFMRSETAMRSYMSVAAAILQEANKTHSIEEYYYFMKEVGICIRKAARAGGFFSTNDFLKWLNGYKYST